jgi:hypothetical protein
MAANPTMPARGHATAPTFDPSQPRELRRYFNELEMLFQRCNITDSEEMKKHACRYVDIDTSELWESIPEYLPTVSFNNFRIAVHKLYPGSEDDRKWSIADMDKLVGEQLRIGIYDENALGLYFRSFYNITRFLHSKNRISDAEQSRAFVRGFQPALWARIARRLELKLPDHYPDDPYPLDDIHTAAKFVLAGTATSRTSNSQTSGSASTSTSVPTTSTSAPQIKSEDLSAIFEKFASTLVTALAGSRPNNNNYSNNAPRPNPGFRQDQLENLICIFCGLSGHFISDCLVCQAYINDGKCKKNPEGKVVLPNGQFTPRNIPGRCIKDRIDEWLRRNPDTTITPALMYGIAPSPAPTTTPRGVYQINDMNVAADIRIARLEQELYALRSGRGFTRTDLDAPVVPVVQPSISSIPPPLAPIVPPIPTVPAPSTSSIATNPPTSNATPASTSQPPVHPYAGTTENSYLPPHERNFAGKSKERDGPSYHTVAPIQNDKIAQDVFSRSMKNPVITLTTEELLSLSPEVRTKWKEQLTPRRIQHQEGNNSAHLVNEEVLMIDDPYEIYINTLRPGEIPRPFVAAKESHSIRSVMMNVNGRNPVESVVDPGSSIIAMSEEVCHELGLAYDPSVHIPLQSANGGIDESLGLARNVPCEVGTITIYMQIHIIRDPAYDILLGRPFDVVTESAIKNWRDETQTITIFDPNSTRSSAIPTFPRSTKRRKIIREDFRI